MKEIKLRVYSDIHMEFAGCDFEIQENQQDKDSFLILAGDIDVGSVEPQEYEDLHKQRFRDVIRISGNHESYNHLFSKTQKEAFVKEFDDVVFICATLWTDFKNFDPIVVNTIQNGLNDYRLIKKRVSGYKTIPITPKDIYGQHLVEREFIKYNVEKYQSADKKIIVVTHHLPLMELVNTERYGVVDLNYAYGCTNMADIIQDNRIDAWIYGHDHSVNDKVMFETRFLSNCIGYVGERNEYTNETFKI